MDSWSRPSKNAATPPPLYLLPGGEATPYCHSCGRVIGSRKVQTSKSSKEIVKYCSERCRHQKPDDIDQFIEDTFVSMLNSEDRAISPPNGLPNPTLSRKKEASAFVKKVKGESRITVLCSSVEELVFGSRYDPEKVFGRRKNRAKRGVPEAGEWKSVDMEDNTAQSYENYSKSYSDGEEHHGDITLPDGHDYSFMFGAGKARPTQNESDVNFSVGGERGWAEKIEETEELKRKRLEGQRNADEREAVRCAARRLCAFGVAVLGEVERGDKRSGAAKGKGKQKRIASANLARDAATHREKRKKCEAVLREGTVVEASFAKGEWGIRWRE